MIADASFRLRQRISDWIFRARTPEPPPAVLTQRRIFILPTRPGYFFAVVLLLMLIASINFSLSLGFMLTFLLAGVAGMAMLHTFRNLVRLSLSPGRTDPVFAGDIAHFQLVAANRGAARFAVGVTRATIRHAEPAIADIGPASVGHLVVPVTSTQRGWLHCGRLEVFTEYPVGLFHAWSYVDFGMRCLVYPRPDPGAGGLPMVPAAEGEGNIPIAGDAEFQSLRAYRPGDTPRQIAWKALAREQGLLVKEFGTTASADLWLDYDALPGLDRERRLGRLTWWVLEAERAGLPYGLRLPGTLIPPSLGPMHRDRCLEALALFGPEPLEPFEP